MIEVEDRGVWYSAKVLNLGDLFCSAHCKRPRVYVRVCAYVRAYLFLRSCLHTCVLLTMGATKLITTELATNRVRVHFMNWSEKHDQTLACNSNRIRLVPPSRKSARLFPLDRRWRHGDVCWDVLSVTRHRQRTRRMISSRRLLWSPPPAPHSRTSSTLATSVPRKSRRVCGSQGGGMAPH